MCQITIQTQRQRRKHRKAEKPKGKHNLNILIVTEHFLFSMKCRFWRNHHAVQFCTDGFVWRPNTWLTNIHWHALTGIILNHGIIMVNYHEVLFKNVEIWTFLVVRFSCVITYKMYTSNHPVNNNTSLCHYKVNSVKSLQISRICFFLIISCHESL